MSTPADRNYTNARRAGRTRPGLIEIIDISDPRHVVNRGRKTTGSLVGPISAFKKRSGPNRAERRASGQVAPRKHRRLRAYRGDAGRWSA